MPTVTVVAFKLENVQFENSTNLSLINEVLPQVSVMLSLTVLGKIDHQFYPQGYTAVLLLSESHVAVHTWPEDKYLVLELLSCKPISQQQIDLVEQYLQSVFANATISTRTMPVL